jgi:hypothetical protein
MYLYFTNVPWGDEWHLITIIHDGVDGLILCVIDTQVYDLTRFCYVCFWLAKIDLMTLFKMFCEGFFAMLFKSTTSYFT